MMLMKTRRFDKRGGGRERESSRILERQKQ